MNVPETRLIDTNIILRFLRQDDPALSQRAKTLFLDAQAGKILCYFDEVTIAETIWVLTSVYKTSRSAVVQSLEEFLVKDWVVNSRKMTMLRALAWYRMSTLHYVDCWLLAVGEEKHLTLETFDVKLKKHQRKLQAA